jgi:hypothetical protein
MQDGIMRIACWITKAIRVQTHSHTICNTYCFSAVKVLVISGPNVKSIRTLPVEYLVCVSSRTAQHDLFLHPEVQKFESPLPVKYCPESQFAAFRRTEYNYANFAVLEDETTLCHVP